MDPECRPGEGIERCISNVVTQVSERQEMIRLAVATEEYRDRLFCFIFGSEEHKDWTLSLYNAVSGTSYTDPNLIRITTLTQVLYMGMQDDVALLIMDELDLYEHQSSFNPNMPLRLMQYTSNIYETLVTLQKKNKYGSKLIPLPVPKLVTFYNGQTDKPEVMMLRLSDAFPAEKRDESDIQVQVRMININPGYNQAMVNRCKPLEEYTWTVAEIRRNRESMEIEMAIDKALDEMPDDFMIRPFLQANRVGVKKMLLTEYNETETMALFREEGLEEGLEKGLEKGREEGLEKGLEKGREEGREETLLENIRNLMRKLKLTAMQAMDILEIPQEEQQKLAKQL